MVRMIYASTLAYLVDSNPGRSAGAVSCNSFVRGSLGCILSQVAIPIQEAIGEGGLYSIVAGLLAISTTCLLLIAGELHDLCQTASADSSAKGESWRQPEHVWPWNKRKTESITDDEKSSTRSPSPVGQTPARAES